MRHEVSFIVRGLAIGKPRPRVTARGAFMPARYRDYQREVKACAIEAFGVHLEAGGRWDVEAPMVLDCTFVFADRRKRDLDNLVGGVMDSLLSVAYRDDSQVIELAARKFVIGTEPSVSVRLRLLGE